MRLIFTLFFILTTYFVAIAQERTISGRLTSTEDGSPLPGVNIIIKGTTIGTVTDIDGNYTIKVQVGQTLVFQFIGLTTQEIVVTKDNFKTSRKRGNQNNLTAQDSKKKRKINKRRKEKKSKNAAPIPSFIYLDTSNVKTKGVAILDDNTFSYKKAKKLNPNNIKSIKETDNGFSIASYSNSSKRKGIGIQYSSAFSVEKINALPSLQNQYAQGRPVNGQLQWRGADQQEIFSWGPSVKTLQFDGSDYPFDKNGRLVPIPNGNQPAKTYNSSSFFKNGLSFSNELMVGLPGPKYSNLLFDIENRYRSGVIPNSDYQRTNLGAHLKNYNFSDRHNLDISLLYNSSKGNLLHRGANLSAIVGSVYRTPVTFDNTNGFSSRSNNETSYILPNGGVRNHAPGLVDNPIGLVNQLPDKDELERFFASVKLRSTVARDFDIRLNGSIELQDSDKTFGIPNQYTGFTEELLTRRNDNQTLVNTSFINYYNHYIYGLDLRVDMFLSYQLQYNDRRLDRTDGFGFSNDSYGLLSAADSLMSLQRDISRTSHEVAFHGVYEYDNLVILRLASRHYFSNTIASESYTNFFPSVGLSVNFAELISGWPVYDLSLYGLLSRSIGESPLIFSDWSYASTQTEIENYTSFYESTELFTNDQLSPETERKFETGINFGGLGSLEMEVYYYNNLTKNFIAPSWNNNEFILQNIGSIQNEGVVISVGYDRYHGPIRWGMDLKWTKANSIVKELSNPDNTVPMAGFNEVRSVYALNQPVGAIYGSTYVRNDVEELIIGNDGFPVKDQNLKMIGNPIPDWTLGWSSYITWKDLRLSMAFDFKKGGDLWNGTNAVLDYLGRSSETAALRNTSNFIFEGVNIDGISNTTPVDFADPSRPLEENRWVRYSWDGVAEEYVEDASWIRLNDLSLTYTIDLHNNNRFKLREVEFSLTGRNLLLITPYTGVDPSANLFGNASGNGLDLFNTPGTRSYSARVTIKL